MKKTRIIIGIAVLSATFFAFNQANDRYFEIAKNLDIFATLFKEVNANYVDEINPTQVINVGINAMLESLDPYTNYIAEDDIEDYRTMTTGQYAGIGAVIGRKGNKNIILMPYEGFPAHISGLKIGDEILAIDGKDMKDKNTNDISKLLKGQAGTKFKIKISRFGQKDPQEIEITRQKIKIENIPYQGMINNEVGYFHLTDFTVNASKDVRDAIIKLKEQGAKKIIFDLRDNPGGLLTEAINIANLFIPKDKEVVSTKSKVADWNKSYLALNNPLDLTIPIIVLTSDHSASAAEIVSGVIQDYDRGILVGEKTFGKGLVQATKPLSYNAQLKVTTAKYYIPSGRCIQAIDYSKKKEDGSATRIADSLRREFKTKNGRKVFDGAGVSPDVKVVKGDFAAITVSLIQKNHIFDYATEYAFNHPKIAPAKEFQLTDAEYLEFTKWLAGKDYDYKTKVETELEDLIDNSKKEKYYDGIKDQIESLKQKIYHNKESDLQKFKSEIIEMLEGEIVTRYYLQKGGVEASFDNDEDIKAALDLFKDDARFKKILTETTASGK
ncbi:MAG: S41 family peptidase [Bacteroidetes bacterium]|nr:MAG: S41 family peptidase [Bacteroidota bacterium]